MQIDLGFNGCLGSRRNRRLRSDASGSVRRISVPVALAVSALVSMSAGLSPHFAHAQSTSLLTNGNFEAGNFNGWTVSNVRDASDVNSTRNFYIDTPGTSTPTVDGFSFNTAANTLPGGGGSSYAVTTSDYPGQTALLQSFTTPTITAGQGLRLTFSFDLFVNDQSGYSNTVQDSAGLDYTTGGAFRANQYARVDLLRFSSSDFSTSAGDVLFNVPLNVPINGTPNTTPNPYLRYSVDLSPYVAAGTQYKIRFAEVDNLSALNLGVDNVGIQADITPEPATLALTLPFLGIAPLLSLRLRRQTKKG